MWIRVQIPLPLPKYMDWLTLSIIAACSLLFAINMIVLPRIVGDIPNNASSWILYGIFSTMVGATEVAAIICLYCGVAYLYEWGLANTVLSFLIITSGLLIPIFGKQLVVKPIVALPYFAKRALASLKWRESASQYRAKLEEKYPIPTKTSVYDLFDE